MKKKKKNKGNFVGGIRLVFNAPVHQINISNGSGGGPVEIPPEAGSEAALSGFSHSKGLEIRSFSIGRPQGGSHYETKLDGTICAKGQDLESMQLRAYIFGGRDITNPPTAVEIESKFNGAIQIPHRPDLSPDWEFPAITGAEFTEGKVNFLIIWQVFDLYTMARLAHDVEFTSKPSYQTWCEIHNQGAPPEASLAAAPPPSTTHSDHPDLYQIAPVSCGNHGASASGCDIASALEGSNILVREPGSHEDYPAWRSCAYGDNKGDWILHQSTGPDGNWNAVLRFIPEQMDDSQSPTVWASNSSWSNRLGGIMVGSRLPELEVRNAG